MLLLRLLTVALLASLAPPALGGSMYQWTDKNGVIHFSDSPIHGQPTIELDSHAPTGKPAQPPARNGDPKESQPEAVPPAGGDHPAGRYEVPYVAQEGRAQRIIVQATLNGRTTVPMLIDTGSYSTIISFGLAERLGLLESDAGRLWGVAGGIGGTVPALYTIIDTIQVGDAQQRFFITTVTKQLSMAFEGIIGMDFLAAYSTQVDPSRKIFVFEELQPGTELYGGHDESWWRAQFKELGSLQRDWKSYNRRLNEAISDAQMSSPDITHLSSFAKQQSEEAGKLFDKLNRHAIQLAVPMAWREY